MSGPLLFVFKGFLVLFFVLQNFSYNSKENSKKVFITKNFTELKFEKWCEAKMAWCGINIEKIA